MPQMLIRGLLFLDDGYMPVCQTALLVLLFLETFKDRIFDTTPGNLTPRSHT